MHRLRKPLLLLLALTCGIAQTSQAASARNDRLKPKGPVTVTADRAELDKSGTMVYLGNVLLASDHLQLRGSRLELKQFAGEQYLAKVSGSPAHMEHSGETDDKGRPQPPMMADGDTLTYDTRSGLLDVNGQAKATRGQNVVTGDNIRYNLNERRVQVSGGNGQQVRIIFQPNEKPSTKQPAPRTTPAPEAASAPKANTP